MREEGREGKEGRRNGGKEETRGKGGSNGEGEG